MSASIPSVRPDAQFVDEHDERLPLARAAYRDRADERMPGVEIRITRRELAPVGAVEVWRLESPPGIERRKPHGIARLDRQHGRKFDREVPVQRGPLEWGSWITSGAATLRSMTGPLETRVLLDTSLQGDPAEPFSSELRLGVRSRSRPRRPTPAAG